MVLPKKAKYLIWLAYAALVIIFAVSALTGDGPAPKPGKKGKTKLVMEFPEDDIPPVSHTPIDKWVAWHGITLKRGDSAPKECFDCHDKKKFCRVCHTYAR